ncbi:MAG: hypothetical protein MH252_11130 [Thermosynechococcaceae cyanobacterium MS004]|nr:hypothetical protein [Thermosynechococcaceae cyanobacterium MS004]
MSTPKSFKEFFDSGENPDKSLPPALQSAYISTTTISTALIGTVLSNGSLFPDDDREKFSQKVSNLAHSEGFIAELSNELGTPSEDETEEEFVRRAKGLITSLLKQKLK